jgi:hypothetical protein
MDLRAFFLPEPRRRLRQAGCGTSARTVHLALSSVLLGDVFSVGRPLSRGYARRLQRCGDFAVELYSSLDYLTEVGGLAVLLKLALLCAIPFAWSARVPILFAVVAVAGIGSHMPGRYRHYSFRHHRVMKESK